MWKMQTEARGVVLLLSTLFRGHLCDKEAPSVLYVLFVPHALMQAPPHTTRASFACGLGRQTIQGPRASNGRLRSPASRKYENRALKALNSGRVK
jgi:hypothetical protein